MIGTEKEEYTPLGLAPTTLNLGKLSEQELLVLRSQVDALLPITVLADMNLERELTLQFRASQALQTAVLDDANTPANQKAQVMNSVSATIQSLVKMQVEYYTPERLKRIELALVRTLQSWPTEQTQVFFEQYEKILEGGM